MKEIAVYGGTFDPPTPAHEAIIEACLARSDIDEVWVMPSGNRSDKPDMQSNKHRLAMLDVVKQAVFNNEVRLAVAEFETNLMQPTETVDTVARLETAYPDERFWFVFGADSYQDMPRWRDGERLQKTLGMLLVQRAGYELPAETNTIRHLKVTDEQLGVLSSTKVRKAIKNGHQAAEYLNRDVLEYIQEHGLYQ